MNFWWPEINSMEDVKAASRSGGFATLVFAGMTGLGFIFTIFGQYELIANEQLAASELTGTLIAIGVETALILLAAWRIFSGKAYVSAILVFALFLFEIGIKVVSGTAGIGWLFAYAAIAAAMFGAIRATLAYKSYEKKADLADAF